jgi:molybdopterin-guanine dinucleotide biosynthesis protein A
MTPGGPQYDAVVLAGGRSSRLGGVAKAGLVLDGETLLQRTCSALAGARSLTVVGPEAAAVWLTDAAAARSAMFVREEPAFAGPAAALAAAFPESASEASSEVAGAVGRSPWCAVVACDMPGVAGLLDVLLAEAAAGDGLSLVAVDGGREQPLAALYRTEDLRAAIRLVLDGGPATNLSVRSLLASVRTRQVPVPPGTTHDVDTWADARALGVAVP